MTIAQRPAARPMMVHPPTWRAMRAEAFAVASRPVEAAPPKPKSAISDTYERAWSLDGKQLGSTAVIPIHGPIHGDETYVNAVMAFLFGGVGHCEIHEALKAALDDESIDSIILDIDSPGGEALGTPELAAAIRAANGIKPVTAYISGMGCSAAYYLASACGRIVVDASALVGSIGTVFCFLDDTEALKKAGLEEIEIVSSQSPHKRLDPKTPQGRASYQKLADDLAAIFISDVAKYRGVSEAKVMSDFGAGDVMVGTEAVKVGMADAVGSQQSVLDDIRSSRGVPRSGKPKAAQGAAALKPQDRPTMKLSNLFSLLQKADPAKLAAVDAILEGTSADESPAVPPSPPAATAAADNPQVKDLQEKLDRIEAERKAERLEGKGREIDITSKAFVDGLLATRKVLPAVATHLTALHSAAAKIEAGVPLPEGFSLSASVASLVEALPTHGIGQQVLRSALPAEATVLPQDGPAAVTPETAKATYEKYYKN